MLLLHQLNHPRKHIAERKTKIFNVHMENTDTNALLRFFCTAQSRFYKMSKNILTMSSQNQSCNENFRYRNICIFSKVQKQQIFTIFMRKSIYRKFLMLKHDPIAMAMLQFTPEYSSCFLFSVSGSDGECRRSQADERLSRLVSAPAECRDWGIRTDSPGCCSQATFSKRCCVAVSDLQSLSL